MQEEIFLSEPGFIGFLGFSGKISAFLAGFFTNHERSAVWKIMNINITDNFFQKASYK
jgi:hypothetical protein